MSTSDLGQFTEQYHRAIGAFAGGDPEPVKKLFSRRDDVTLANPLGPPVRGWSQVEQSGCGQRSVPPTSSRRSHCALRPSFDEKLVSGKSSIVMPMP